MHLGTNIRFHRQHRGWSQEALAANMPGFSQSKISRIENNTQPISWVQIKAFAHVFGLSTDDLIHPQLTEAIAYNQSGGEDNNTNNYNGHEAALAAKDELIAAKNEVIDVLKSRIRDLER